MIETPLFSIVIPLYNCRDYIADAIRSVLHQTFQKFEIIVIDDGSTDDSAEVVKSFKDPRIRYIRQANQGVSAARNSGIAAACGEFIAFLDADDYWHKQHLAMAYKAFETHDINWYASKYSRTAKRYSDNADTAKAFLSDSLQIHDYCQSGFWHVWSSCTVIRRTAISQLRFKEGMRYGEDLLFWFDFSLENPQVAVSEHTAAFYYERPDSACNVNPPRGTDVIEYLCDHMIARKDPDEKNFLLITKIYVLFYRKLRNNGRQSALAALKSYESYLSRDIKAIFTISAYCSLILKSHAAKIAYLYLRLRNIIR